MSTVSLGVTRSGFSVSGPWSGSGRGEAWSLAMVGVVRLVSGWRVLGWWSGSRVDVRRACSMSV